MDKKKDIAWATRQIKTLLNNYEGERLPPWVVEAVRGL